MTPLSATAQTSDLVFVGIFPHDREAALRICVAVRSTPDPVAGWLVPLFQTADANVYLGGVCDARGHRKDWLEIWVQTVGRERGEVGSEWNNAYLDARWRERCEVLTKLTPSAVLGGGWEEEHPLPSYLARDDKGRWAAVHPRHPSVGSEGAWRLCQDDSVLRRAGLPRYGESSERYLYEPDLGPEGPLIPAGATAGRGRRLTTAEPEQGFGAHWVGFNPAGGLMFVRRHGQWTLTQFKWILEGYGWEGSGQGRGRVWLAEADRTFGERGYAANNHGLIFSGRWGRSGRVLECYLLKLMLFREVLVSVATALKAEGRPFLDLQADDFRVAVDDAPSRLPRLWAFRLQLGRTSESIAVDIQAGGARFYRPSRPVGESVYRSPDGAKNRPGRGSVRIRNVRDGTSEGTLVLEGTLSSSDLSISRPSDLVRLELPVRSERKLVYVRPVTGANLARDEVRFESLPLLAEAATSEALLALNGVSWDLIPFEVLPQLSSPSDLYSLAVIGLEILLDSRRVRLEMALDECRSLARAIAAQPEGEALTHRRARALDAEPRFAKSLGPQNLLREDLTEEQVAECLPPELWWPAFDILVRMLPGVLRDGWARDLGDAEPSALHACLQPALEELDALLERVRCVLFGDWVSNREALTVIDEFA
jgi:hypothetical protein